MKHSGFDIDKINNIPYSFNMKTLTKYQKNERFNLDANGGLISSISDLKKFINFKKLLNKTSMTILETLFFFTYNKKENVYILEKSGFASGTGSLLTIKYDTNRKLKSIWINFSTNLKFDD